MGLKRAHSRLSNELTSHLNIRNDSTKIPPLMPAHPRHYLSYYNSRNPERIRFYIFFYHGSPLQYGSNTVIIKVRRST